MKAIDMFPGRLPRFRITLTTMLIDFTRYLNDLGSEFGSMSGLIAKLVLAELRFTDRPRRVREAKRISEIDLND